MKLQAEPDALCQQWLATDAGQEFVACDTDNPGLPKPYNTSNNCMLTTDDFNLYCNNSCYEVVLKAWEFFLNTSTCLSVQQHKYGPCQNNSDCPMLPGNVSRICYQGFCYTGCNQTSDCNSCMDETCVDLGTLGNVNGTNGTGTNTTNNSNFKICRSSEMSFANNTNRTLETGFKGMIYSLKAGCSKNNSTGDYCGLMTLENQTCASLEQQYGCCAATILPSSKYCEWTNYTNTNYTNLLNCNWTVQPCNGLEWAWQACAITNNTNGNNSSSSSGMSSGMSSSGSGSGSSSMSSGMSSMSSSGMSSSGSSSFTGSSSYSSSSVFGSNMSSPTGPNLNTTGNGATGNKAISWTMTIALVLAAAHILS